MFMCVYEDFNFKLRFLYIYNHGTFIHSAMMNLRLYFASAK